MTDPYANIRRALEMGPTPGRWVEYETPDGRPYVGGGDGSVVAFMNSDDDKLDADIALVAACDPDTIRALLAERDALARDAERLDWLASEAQPLWGSRDRGGYELPYFDITSGRECCDPGDLRAAIDQARGKENGNG